MKSIFKRGIVILVALFLVTPHVMAYGKGGDGRGNGGQGYGGGGSSTPTLTQAEKEGLLQMREEEKLARDVYRHLFSLWGQPSFENIAASEQRHMDAVLNLLNKYGLPDPTVGKSQGEFSDEHIQQLYNDLTAAGGASRAAALQVGATIEDLDIFDLKELLAETENQQITRIYSNLLRGSRNHLRAFAGQLDLLGEQYVAQYLTQDEIDAVINSPKERGPHRSKKG